MIDRKQQIVRRLLDQWRTEMPVIHIEWDSPQDLKDPRFHHRLPFRVVRSDLLYNSRMGLAARERK